jgi:hypothetical protein
MSKRRSAVAATVVGSVLLMAGAGRSRPRPQGSRGVTERPGAVTVS